MLVMALFKIIVCNNKNTFFLITSEHSQTLSLLRMFYPLANVEIQNTCKLVLNMVTVNIHTMSSRRERVNALIKEEIQTQKGSLPNVLGQSCFTRSLNLLKRDKS